MGDFSFKALDQAINQNKDPNALTKAKSSSRLQFQDPILEGRGKLPKFAFGMKTRVKTDNQDVPGPGAYETDQYPSYQKNISYWIGTSERRELGQKSAGELPGPGSYDYDKRPQGPSIS